jgi:hypothetical protein
MPCHWRPPHPRTLQFPITKNNMSATYPLETKLASFNVPGPVFCGYASRRYKFVKATTDCISRKYRELYSQILLLKVRIKVEVNFVSEVYVDR